MRQLFICVFALSVAAACSERSSQPPGAMAGAGGGYTWAGGGEVGSGGAEAADVGSGGGGAFEADAETGAGEVSSQRGATVDGGIDASVDGADGLDGGSRPVNTGNKVTFYEGQARGAMTGRGWVGLGPSETLLGPACPRVLLSPGLTCSADRLSSPTSLCADGTVLAYQASDPTRAGGLLVAVYATEPPGGVLGQSFQSIRGGFAALPTRGTQFYVHRKGDPRDTVYRAYVSSSGSHIGYDTVAFNAFSTEPYPPDAGLALSPEDVPNLDWIGVYLPLGEEPTVTLCLASIEFQ